MVVVQVCVGKHRLQLLDPGHLWLASSISESPSEDGAATIVSPW
jgi:hypothetical protein